VQKDTTTEDLSRVPLAMLADGDRFARLDRLESYYRCTQDDGKSYSWDGYFSGYGDKADISPGWFVPYRHRRPSTRYDLARVIVDRLTSFMFGTDRFPRILVPGDKDAEDFVNALAEASRFASKVAQARTLGGSCGSVAMSIGFVNGSPRVEVHNAKHTFVTRWADREDLLVGSAVKVFAYKARSVEDGKIKEREFYSVRFWDEDVEIVWDPIPAEIARTGAWWHLPHRTIRHQAGFCPMFWIQNLPGPDGDMDGEADFPERLCETFDELNQLLSASTKGTKANVDPTLVVRMDPTQNDGTLKRGSDNVIWSPGGANYLELQGAAANTAIAMLERLRAYALDMSSVVIPDPEKLSGAAQSAAALRLMFAPMTAKCDLLREQYGELAIKRPLLGLLRMARALLNRAPTTIMGEDGTEYELTTFVRLPPKVIEDGETVRVEERRPGTSELLVLQFPAYFPATAEDRGKAVDTAQKAAGGKPLVSQRTALASVADLFGVRDVDAELDAVHEDAEREVQRAADVFAANGGPAGGVPPDSEEPDEPDEDED
jgi:hypothetical protein